MKKIQLLIYVDLDPIPGAFHTEESAFNNIQGVLTDRFRPYEPRLIYSPDSVRMYLKRRAIFILDIGLDSIPGTMHTVKSAQETVAAVLTDVIGHYNPTVHPVPNTMNVNTEGTN